MRRVQCARTGNAGIASAQNASSPLCNHSSGLGARDGPSSQWVGHRWLSLSKANRRQMIDQLDRPACDARKGSARKFVIYIEIPFQNRTSMCLRARVGRVALRLG